MRVQFERQGYFWPDPNAGTSDALVYNQVVSLRDTWGNDEDRLSAEELEQRRQEKKRQKKQQRHRSLKGKTDPVEQLSDEQRARFDHYFETLGLTREDAATIASDEALSNFFEAVVDAYDAPQPAANWIVNELLGELSDRTAASLPFDAEQFATLVRLVDTDAIPSRAAREVLEEMLSDGVDPEAFVQARGLRQVDDTEKLTEIVEDVMSQHPDKVQRYRNGKEGLIGFFMGQVMEATDGTANPELARDLLQRALAKEA